MVPTSTIVKRIYSPKGAVGTIVMAAEIRAA
jgi:hypothetical protein